MNSKTGSDAGTILVVEDHQETRMMVNRELRMAGYYVFDASGAAEALTLAEAHPGHVDLLVSEVLLWGMTGVELYGRLRQRHQSLRVLFMSGYTEEVLQQNGVSPSTAPFLRKPFASPKLVERVKEVLQAPAPAVLARG
ncbi:MAG TPA: response regulator [Gemmatimonadales bacterium]|nr:response regulator [Gemmatimonadales bacterium]